MKQNDDSENYIGLERLVKKAKAGDQQAKEKLIFAFRPLILTTIQKYVYDQKEYEDAYQDAVCVFLEALRDFELDARVYFQVFIRLRLTNYFKKRREGRFERSVKPEESLDRQIEGEGGAIALIELIIDEKTDVAEAYLNSLYSDEAQRIAGDNYYRPSNQDILKEYSDVFDLDINLVTIDDFGGWKKAQETHFSDGGIFDQIYEG